MKERLRNPVLPPQFKAEQGIKLEPCIECKKPITDGYWGRYTDGGVCSKICDVLHMQKRRNELFNHPAGE